MFNKTVLATLAAFAVSGVAFADNTADAPGTVPAGVVQVTDAFVDQGDDRDVPREQFEPVVAGFKAGRDTVLGATEPVTSGLAGAIETGWAGAPEEAAPLVAATQAVDDAVVALAQGAFGAASAIVTLPESVFGTSPPPEQQVQDKINLAVTSLVGGVEGAAAELEAFATGEEPPDDGGDVVIVENGVRSGKVGEVSITATGNLAEINNRCELITTAIEFTFEGEDTSFSDFSGESGVENLSIRCGSERGDTTVFLSTTDTTDGAAGSAAVDGKVGDKVATFTIRYSGVQGKPPIGDTAGTKFAAAETAAADIELLATFDKELFRDTGGAISFKEDSAIFVYIDDQTAPDTTTP